MRPRFLLIALVAATLAMFQGAASAAAPDTVAIDLLPDTDASTAATNDTAPGTANEEECDADTNALDGPTWEDQDADPLNVVHLVCVSATEGGTVSNGMEVTLTTGGVGSIVDSMGAPADGTEQIDSEYAKFYITSTEAGLQTLTATIGSVSDTAEKFWQPEQCPGWESTTKKSKKNKVKGATHIVGTPWDDLLTGSGGKQIICGFGGNDTLNGKGGKDVLLGGEGDDSLNGGNGKDTLDGGPGANACSGGRGKDTERGC